jgi:hypothetical protein
VGEKGEFLAETFPRAYAHARALEKFVVFFHLFTHQCPQTRMVGGRDGIFGVDENSPTFSPTLAYLRREQAESLNAGVGENSPTFSPG